MVSSISGVSETSTAPVKEKADPPKKESSEPVDSSVEAERVPEQGTGQTVDETA
jgi:hypothetical protein